MLLPCKACWLDPLLDEVLAFPASRHSSQIGADRTPTALARGLVITFTDQFAEPADDGA